MFNRNVYNRCVHKQYYVVYLIPFVELHLFIYFNLENANAKKFLIFFASFNILKCDKFKTEQKYIIYMYFEF